MFSIASECYQLDPKALKSGVLVARWSEVGTDAQAALTVPVTSSQTPGDRLRQVNEVCIVSTAGAGQTSSMFELEVLGPGLNRLYSRQVRYSATLNSAITSALLDWILLPGEWLRATPTFNAAVQINTVEVRIIGYELPRGNVM